MLDPNGNVCEFDRVIDPTKMVPSNKTLEELEAETEKIRQQILEKHKEE